MRNGPGLRTLSFLLVGLLLAGVTTPAVAQDRPRSDTGRSRPEPPPPTPETVAAQENLPNPPAHSWFLTFDAGVTGGSDLFRAETVNGALVYWPGSPFRTERFNARLGSGLALGLGVGHRLGDLFNLRLDLNWSELDVVAESTVGQVGEIFTYETLGIWEIAVGGEVRLVRQASAPYLGLGVVLQGISAALADDLDQQQMGVRLALGYQLVVATTVSLRVEGRLTRAGFDASNHQPVTEPPTEILVTSEDSHTLWQLKLGVQMEL